MAESTLKAFYRTKALDQVKYTTLEFHNPNAGTRRFVTEQVEDKDFLIESGAPLNAGEVVTFQAVAFSAPEPEQSESGAMLNIDMGAIGFEAKPYLEAVMTQWPQRLDVRYRQYLSGYSQPQLVVYLEGAEVTINDSVVSIQAEQVNQAARNIAVLYDTETYPGLRRNA